MEHEQKKQIGKGALYTAAAVACIGAYAWFNGTPQPSRAAGPDGQILYGINPSNANLYRYDFDATQLETIGSVTNNGAAVMTGIEASAYFPGFSNIFGFWQDPADNLTKVVYINPTTANGIVMGTDLGPEKITAACAVHPDGTNTYQVFALQESDVIPFDIDDNTSSDTGTTASTVDPDSPYATRIAVLGGSHLLRRAL